MNLNQNNGPPVTKIKSSEIRVFYGESEALHGVNLEIYENSVTALIGPSGCGKSTFLRCINRMNDVIEGCRITGKITLDNEDIYDRGLDVVQLREKGGQQQRLCIARAIAVNPEVILMDEPCSALDPIATAKIEELIEELKQKYTIIIVTHSMQQAARVSQRTAFFHMGNLVEVGKTDDIFIKPIEKQTQDYITGRFG